jgi:hypothetical protein
MVYNLLCIYLDYYQGICGTFLSKGIELYSFFLSFYFETGSHYVAQTNIELEISCPCFWSARFTGVPPHLASSWHFSCPLSSGLPQVMWRQHWLAVCLHSQRSTLCIRYCLSGYTSFTRHPAFCLPVLCSTLPQENHVLLPLNSHSS